MTFNEKRKELGLSVAVVSKLIGAGKSTIYNYEKGRKPCIGEKHTKRMDALYEVLKKVQRDPDYLLKSL